MHSFNWLIWLSGGAITHDNMHIVTAALIAVVILTCAALYRLSLKSIDQEIVPDGRVSLKNVMQFSVEKLLEMMEGIMGHDAKHYFPLIGALFIYIFLNNLMGVIPGFVPATDNINTTVACSITVFVFYNVVGIRTQGLKNYIAHFMGPIWWLAWLMLPIELISHLVRPVSLGVRLFGNITGDHMVMGIFSGLVPLVVPVIFMLLGIFVSFIQAFVFSLLSSVYIGLAVAHEEHH